MAKIGRFCLFVNIVANVREEFKTDILKGFRIGIHSECSASKGIIRELIYEKLFDNWKDIIFHVVILIHID